MAFDFHDKTVLITGAAGNLGRAVADAFARAGARLVLVDRPGVSPALPAGEHLAVEADLLDAAAVKRVVEQAIGSARRIDVVCNLAGGFGMGPVVGEGADAQWERMFDLNLRTVLNVSRAVVPHMIAAGGGRIVNVGANSSARGLAQMGAYCASKDALARLTEALSAEVRDQGIHVNAVLPSVLDTPENRAAMPDADASRWVDPAALADAILFLASDAARAIHGALLPVVNRA
ncbi:SDR family NAD(P)-dependent oxidoreductase [Cupriavidus gilardii]|uniref:SDR family NAD(P)-dependent oxidoreductase n=1 Tax=Cupriavidus gilardii TaxID=82541 RepID=A0A6N1B9R5_9BURK|nr:SDR family NAD(P)-dependent oxidoreductase [Cupriavidus gilardii]ALD92825.1 3-oxoacyl-(acyl-carrier-protein) reductase [Cupriavidus gilardii CR3]KAB0597518.1 SDR family NAD(P)-dependent oxidoreductase [Cupriavidus gilardii]MCT9014496.1 SDR family NAD(P)-dependent oxidoreductase [Cupriavidus gilardii]MCT9054216.1 SDR family NAD(P)-dependent oxidoreductase [Cupriavidus gilardii]MCT9071433.1 SDR family NAD(P)-dependent oxidoreductase [Cupriavidus gilardii]